MSWNGSFRHPGLDAFSGPTEEHLRIERSEQPGGAIVLRLFGELDIESAQTLAGVLRERESGDATRIVVDLSGVEFIDSAGISVLLRARMRAVQRSREFVLSNLSRNVARCFRITGISSSFTII
ncbi:MAG TPA: STAS domain-containing protein [Solirubrobacteraceae bacterium]|nr:STAS domain-containing protein [Solirubrobacteraceae bacterium]